MVYRSTKSSVVVYHYYPDNEIVSGDYNSANTNEFWYFNPVPLNDEDIVNLEQKGTKVVSYGEMQISQYPFYLYHMEKAN